MSEFIKVKMTRRIPINLVMGMSRSTEEWVAEQKEYHVKLSSVTSVRHEYDNIYQVVVDNSPLTKEEEEIFKLVSSDPRLVDLI